MRKKGTFFLQIDSQFVGLRVSSSSSAASVDCIRRRKEKLKKKNLSILGWDENWAKKLDLGEIFDIY